MSNKFSPVVASNTTAGDRLLLGGAAARHLSTGDLVMLAHDPSQADPNSLSLMLVSAHTTPSTIATLLFGAGSGYTFHASTASQAFALERDDQDNLYVIGCYQTGGRLAYQAFVKGVGLNWTATSANVCTGTLTGSPNPVSFAAKWCNTGGGTGAAGHIIVAAQTSGAVTGCFILDAGLMLAGQGQHGSVTTNPSFLGASTTTTCLGGNLDLEQDGFGATTGVAISSNGTANPLIASWGVSATGLLTAGGGFVASPTSAALTATTKLRVVRVSPNLFAAVYPSSANAGQLTVVSFFASSGSGSGSTVDTGTAGNFPAPSASLSWDVAAAAPIMETIWIYGWSSATATTMLRLPVTLATGGLVGGAPTVGSVVTDDTTVGTGTNTTIRVVKQPVDFAHTDWQSYDTVTPFSLLGDYSDLPTQPNVPTLISPTNGSAAPLASGGVLDWAFGSEQPGDAQVGYYLRIQAAGGGPLKWWNGTALVGTEAAVTSPTTSATLTTGILSATTTYSWSVDVVGASGLRAGYSLPWSFTVLTPPAAPTLTATYDPVLNQTDLTIQGSVSSAPTGSIEFSDDGGTTWYFVIGCTQLTVYPGPLTVYDGEGSSQSSREYRARNWSGAPTNYSAYVTASVGAVVLSSYWVKDLTGTGISIAVLLTAGTWQRTINETTTIREPLGNEFDVVVGDDVHAPTGQVTLVCQNQDDQSALFALLSTQNALFVQHPVSASFWMRRLTNVESEVPVDGNAYVTHFENALTWTTVGRPSA